MWPRHFPATRLRRSRSTNAVRELVSETTFSPGKLIWPLFVYEGLEDRQPISSMPGVYRLNQSGLKNALEHAIECGLGGIMLFPYVESRHKNSAGSYATDQNNIIFKALSVAKDYTDRMCIISDCALDPYTSHGHDGVLNKQGYVDNDATTETLVEQSLCHARHGADTIAPSDMMDGRIGRIREVLDAQGYNAVRLMSYAAKYASAYYGPFRDAIGSSCALSGDKRTYQMDSRNAEEAIHEAGMDISEGADWLIVKPGLPYLDILAAVRQRYRIPTFSYQVSGEYMMLTRAMKDQPDKGRALLLETLTSFFRAGASGVITYFAPQIARWLSGCHDDPGTQK